ncbi:ABC transporter substrate-binding protein [Bordetella sp. H567]|uniref:ABC transporter substrate-binding protein n=1 Tax=Bordetella sp. H567 TaxID=1697043 RepID=UPI00082ADEAF|nr:ABC transporter substrate-binding protein [Bordetella sp. H567]
MSGNSGGIMRSRRALVQAGAAAFAGAMLGMPTLSAAQSKPVKIRYATGGGIGPNEMETVIFLDWMQKNVLQQYGKAYVVDMTYTRGTPEAATLLAADQADMATLSFSVFATLMMKGAIPDGLAIVADNYQDAKPGYAANTFFVLDGSPIQKIEDLRGKRIGVNAYGSAVDLGLRVRLKKSGLDARKDVEIVEIAFPNIGPALREKRIDCGVLVIPFMIGETAKGGLRPLFNGGDAFGTYAPIFQVATRGFIKSQRAAVSAFLADYVRGLQWFYDPANRKQAIALTAGFTKSPPELLDSYFLTNKDYYRDRNACVDAALIQRPVDAMVEQGLIAKPLKITDYLDASLLPGTCAS